MKDAGLGLARRWIEAAFAPGAAEQILARLAEKLWGETIPMLSCSPASKSPSGGTLLDWARQRGVDNLSPAGIRSQLMYIGPEEHGFCLFVRLRSKQPGNLERELRRKLETSPTYRWVFAHELGHTYFYDVRSHRPRKPYATQDPEEEQLCQRFASELLMPRKRVEWLAEKRRIQTLEAMLGCVRVFGVPILSLARRVISELEIVPATFAIVSAPTAEQWRRKPDLAQQGSAGSIQIVSPRNAQLKIEPRDVALSQVVQQVSVSRSYSNTAECPRSSSTFPFVEATLLKAIAPRGSIVCLFHESKPRFPRDTLFDAIDGA